MNRKDAMISQLIHFRDCDKFEVYKDRQPAVANSTDKTKDLVNDEMRFCCDELLYCLNSEAPQEKELYAIVRSSKDQIDDLMLDTEDEEFCYVLFSVIGDILGIDVEDHSVSMEQVLLQQIQRLMENGGIRPEDLPGLLGEAGVRPEDIPPGLLGK